MGCFLQSEFLIPFKIHLCPQVYRKRDNCEVFGHNEGRAITKGIYTLLQIISCKHRNYVKTPQHETRVSVNISKKAVYCVQMCLSLLNWCAMISHYAFGNQSDLVRMNDLVKL